MDSKTQDQTTIGRFAPSPTGPLHIGSLLAALGSFLQAKNQNGKWLVRIEDLDPPREVVGAADNILRALERFHLYWDNEVVYQSQRHEYYRNALDCLRKNELIYPCTCSRKMIQEVASIGPLGMIYPGTCRPKKTVRGRHSLRLIIPPHAITFIDKHMGEITTDVLQSIGDVNLFRADGFYAYHLAVVIDDFEQSITEIVRGSDLLQSTPVHIHLQQYLDYPTPEYLHLPVLENLKGEKLSKQTGAQSIENEKPEDTLLYLLDLLGQKPPMELKEGNLDEILNWGITHWRLNNIPKNNIKIVQQKH